MRYNTNPIELETLLNHFHHDLYELYHKVIIDEEPLTAEELEFFSQSKQVIDLFNGNRSIIFNSEELVSEYEEMKEVLLTSKEKVLTNAGYEIIGNVPCSHREGNIVLGENAEAGMYVTWYFEENSGYLWGHYFDNYDEALLNMFERAE